MANRVQLGNIGSSQFGLKVSKPSENVLTTDEKNLIFDSRKNRNGQVVGGGVGINFDNGTASTSASETQGVNFLSVTGIQKEQLGFVPLVLHVEKNTGEFEVFTAGDNDFYVSNLSMIETTSTLICPVSFIPTNDTSNETQHTGIIDADVPTRGRSYDNLSSSAENCLNCSYYVLRIPCGYGYMTSSFF